MEHSVTLSAPIDFWTHYKASRAVISRTWNTYLSWAFFFGVPLALVVGLLLLHQDVAFPGLFGWPAWMLPIIGFTFMGVLMPLVHMFNVYSYRRRNRSVESVQTYSITPNEYAVSGSLFDTKLKWDAFIKARETKHFFLLYISSRAAHFIPKSAFKSTSDLHSVRSLIMEKLGSNARLYSDG
jgi:hypothetical protein